MRYTFLALVLFGIGCSGSSPTAPTPTPPVVVVPPVVTPPVVTPPVVTPPTPTRNPLVNDPRYNASFYRMFALGALEYAVQPLRRQTQPPRLYLRTVDDKGNAIDSHTLDQTASALLQTAAQLTGDLGPAGLERGTESRIGQKGWITVEWIFTGPAPNVCGRGQFGGDRMELYHRSTCRCSGGPAVSLSVVKHELGHTLGFYHTDDSRDLMYRQLTSCDQQPSDRELFHARVAYSQPIGSLDP